MDDQNMLENWVVEYQNTILYWANNWGVTISEAWESTKEVAGLKGFSLENMIMYLHRKREERNGIHSHSSSSYDIGSSDDSIHQPHKSSETLEERYGLSDNECPVCWCPYTIDVNPSIACINCASKRCVDCFVRHMINNKTFPICNVCSVWMDEMVLCRYLSQKKISEIQKHVKNIIWDQEKSKIPVVLAKIERDGFMGTKVVNGEHKRLKTDIKNMSMNIDVCRVLEEKTKMLCRRAGNRESRFLDIMRNVICYDPSFPSNDLVYPNSIPHIKASQVYRLWQDNHINLDNLDSFMVSIDAYLANARSSIRVMQMKLSHTPKYHFRDIKGNILQSGISSNTRRGFVVRCTWDQCDGFLSGSWYCLKCTRRTCSICHCAAVSDHICLSDDIETAKYKIVHTRNCPRCAAGVERISGCSHMWCTACHTSFDYNTLRIISDSKNTNPHYGEWLKYNSGADAKSCDPNRIDIPSRNRLANAIIKSSGTEEIFFQFFQLWDLVADHDSLHSIIGTPSRVSTKRTEEILEYYIAGIYDEERTKTECYRIYRIEQRNRHNDDIKNTVLFVGRTILHNVLEAASLDDLQSLIGSMHQFRKHINSSFQNISKVLGYKTTTYISPNMKFFNKVGFCDWKCDHPPTEECACPCYFKSTPYIFTETSSFYMEEYIRYRSSLRPQKRKSLNDIIIGDDIFEDNIVSEAPSLQRRRIITIED